MRVIVFLLILANLLFFSWSRGYLGVAQGPDALRVQQQVSPELVSVVVRDLPTPGGANSLQNKEAEPKPEERKVPETCWQLSDLSLTDIIRVEGLVGTKYPAFRTERTMNPGSGHYWVFIPPLPSKQDADRKAGELRRMQVPEFFIVQDSTPYRYAISLGIFSSKEAASERLAELREKGVRSAKVGERDLKPPSGALSMQGPEAQFEALRLALKEMLPNGKGAVCRAKAAVTAQ